jgi:hypothetical protein
VTTGFASGPEVLVTQIALKARIGFSLAAVGITWLLSGIAFSIYVGDVRALVAFLIWSIPFFALGYVTVGVPLIAFTGQLPLKPGLTLVLGIAGVIAGGMIMLVPGVYVRWVSPASHFMPYTMAELTGWPLLGAAIGAAAMLFYGWLLSRYAALTQKGS